MKWTPSLEDQYAALLRSEFARQRVMPLELPQTKQQIASRQNAMKARAAKVANGLRTEAAILEVLDSEEYTAREISQMVGRKYAGVFSALTRMRDKGLVARRDIKRAFGAGCPYISMWSLP